MDGGTGSNYHQTVLKVGSAKTGIDLKRSGITDVTDGIGREAIGAANTDTNGVANKKVGSGIAGVARKLDTDSAVGSGVTRTKTTKIGKLRRTKGVFDTGRLNRVDILGSKEGESGKRETRDCPKNYKNATVHIINIGVSKV